MDESQSVIHCVKGRIRVCHFPDEHLFPHCAAKSDSSVILWRIFSWMSPVSSYGRNDHESYKLSQYHCTSFAHLRCVCLYNWKWRLLTGQYSVFQCSDYAWMVWGILWGVQVPNSSYFNLIEHMRDVIEQQLGVLKHHHGGISWNWMTTDWTSGITSLWTKTLYHPCQGDLQFFCSLACY